MRRIDPAQRHDAVQVDVQGQVLSPGVQHGDDSRLGTEIPRVARELQQTIGGGPEEQAVDQSRSTQRQGVERVRQREDHVRIVDREQLCASSIQPALLGDGLTLGAMTITTRAPDGALLTAVGAGLADPSQGGSAAVLDRPQRRELLAG